MQGAGRAVVPFTTSGPQRRNVPPSRPALRVATGKCVCGVAKLANGITIRCASRLAAIVFRSQRARRIKSDRLLVTTSFGVEPVILYSLMNANLFPFNQRLVVRYVTRTIAGSRFNKRIIGSSISWS